MLQIAERIDADLRDHGSTSAAVGQLPISTQTWRRLARAIARAMKRPIRTELMTGRVTAFITDWPREQHEAIQLRRYLTDHMAHHT